MSAEVVYPNNFPQCAGCEFAQRAKRAALRVFPQATEITMSCEPSGVKSRRQIKPGEFIEFQNRYLTVTPDIASEDSGSRYLVGSIPTCLINLPISPTDYPRHPYFEQVYKDTSGEEVGRHDLLTVHLKSCK